jgi:hypothetical protein
VLAVLIALASGVVNGSQRYEHLLVDGDPAVYAVTGALLARTGELTVPTRAEELFGGNETVEFAGSGYFDTRGEPTVYPQFFHLLPVLLAVGSWLGGTSLLLLVNPVLGAFSLLAFYSFAARVVRPGWALLSMASLAVLLPQLHFSRDAFSEIPSQLLVFAGLALLWDVTGPQRRTGWPAVAGGLVTGLVLGGSAMARIDAFLYLVPLAAALLLVRAGWTGLAIAAGAGISASVALVDGYLGSPVYVESVEGPLLQTAAALVLVAVAAVVVRRPRAWVPRLGAWLAWPVAGLVVGLAAFAWFVRPLVQVTRRIPDRTNETIASLQAAEGLTVDVPRSYDELTMVWLSWYLGPAGLALGVLGLAWLSWRVLRGQDLRLAPFVLLVGLATAVYVWHPGIFPVQYWASRRFLPVTFPGLILTRCGPARRVGPLAGLAAHAASDRRASVLAFPLACLPGATLPRNYDGMAAAVVQMCGSLLPSDVVLLVGGAPGDRRAAPAGAGLLRGGGRGRLRRDDAGGRREVPQRRGRRAGGWCCCRRSPTRASPRTPPSGRSSTSRSRPRPVAVEAARRRLRLPPAAVPVSALSRAVDGGRPFVGRRAAPSRVPSRGEHPADPAHQCAAARLVLILTQKDAGLLEGCLASWHSTCRRRSRPRCSCSATARVPTSWPSPSGRSPAPGSSSARSTSASAGGQRPARPRGAR